MADHGFERIGDVLRKLGVSQVPSTATLKPDEPVPSCGRCRDFGWLSDDGRAVECPCGVVQQRRIARIWEHSQVPVTMRGYTLASFADKSGKHELAADVRTAWDGDTRWLLFVGEVGLGKTGIAVSLLNEQLAAGQCGLYVVTPTFLSRVRATYGRGKDGDIDETAVMSSLIETPLLVLDDLGKVALTEWGQEKLFTVVNERYLNHSPQTPHRTIVTSNLDIDNGDLEEHLWPATFDRIRGISEIFRLSGGSLR